MKITFLGAAGTVTGSKYLVEENGRRLLIDCGLFQGFKQLRLRNWEPLPIEPRSIESVILTHAHLDHSGYLPLLVRNGFKGRVYCTAATADLCAILLPDAAHLQEQDAEFANRHGFSKPSGAPALYRGGCPRGSVATRACRIWTYSRPRQRMDGDFLLRGPYPRCGDSHARTGRYEGCIFGRSRTPK